MTVAAAQPFRRLGWAVALLLAGTAAARADEAPLSEAVIREQVTRAVQRGLECLASRQGPDGTFPRDGWGDNTAILGLAGMAFLAAGHTPMDPRYGANINRLADFILTHQGPDGSLYFASQNPIGHAPMYAHGIATLFLSELSGMSDAARQARMDRGLSKAVRLILDAQAVPKATHMRGGWRYSPLSADSDLSVSGWNLMALRSARINGAQVPAASIERAVAYVRSLCNRQGGFGYMNASRSPAMSGVGMLCLSVCGFPEDPAVEAAGRYILGMTLPSGDIGWPGGAGVPGRVEYTIYYCTNGMFQLGGQYWEQYMQRVYPWILRRQGSDGSWGGAYGTAMMLLSLCVTHRQLPIYQR
jgi:hypothetical protein